MKKLLALLLVFGLIAAMFCGCDSGSKKDDEEEKKETIGKMGDTVSNDTWKLTLRDAKTYASLGDEYWVEEPDEGNEYLVLFLTAENTSSEDSYFNYMFFMTAKVDGEEATSTFLMNDPEGEDSIGGDIAAGETRKGYVAWEVPVGWETFEVCYEEYDGGPIKFTITADDIG